MPKKKQTGSVYHRSDGRWCAHIVLNGKRVTRSARTERDAKKILKELRAQVRQEKTAAPKVLTLAEWIEQWLTIKAPNLRQSSLFTYREALAYVTRFIGDQPLDSLTPMSLTLAYAQLQQKHTAPRQLNLSHGYLQQCLDYAVRFGLLDVNPLRSVPKPKWTPRRRKYWTFEETSRFIDTALAHTAKYSPLFVLMVTTGMRVSEALGLTWAEVDLEKKTVEVVRALVWITSSIYVEEPPKSAAGYRTIALPDAAVTALRKIPTKNTYLFHTIGVGLPTLQDLRQRLLAMCRRAGVPEINIHGLRHVHAMLALEVVKDPYLVQQRLGHASIAVTLAVYGYPTRDESVIADELNKRLGKE